MRYWRPWIVTFTWLISTGSWLRLDDRADAIDRHVKALRDLAIGRFELARARRRGIEIGCKLGAIRAERMHLRGERVLAFVGVASPLQRALERIKSSRQPPGRGFDRARVNHRLPIAR